MTLVDSRDARCGSLRAGLTRTNGKGMVTTVTNHTTRSGRRRAQRAGGAALVALVVVLAGCATVRPEQRAVLADPVMQFDSDPHEARATQHVLENREGSYGGSSVKGGGCGCN